MLLFHTCSDNVILLSVPNKAKAIRADLGGLDLDFEDIFSFGDIKVLVTFNLW